MISLYKLIRFHVKHGNCGGSLVQFQRGDTAENALPFPIGKVLVMSDIRPDDIRGLHAHHATEEILVALQGGCTVEMDDGRGNRETVRLGTEEGRGQRSEVGGQFLHHEVHEGHESSTTEITEGTEVGSGVGRIPEHSRNRNLNPDRNLPASGSASESGSKINHDTQPALLLYPHVWRTMRDFAPGTILLVVADRPYDEADYIRNYEDFKACAAKWTDLGGSAAKGG